MTNISLTIPEELELKVQGFEQQATQALRDLCDKCNIDDSLTEVLLKELARFLRGKRCEDTADIEAITKEVQSNKAFRTEIVNCGHYYISRMFYHCLYCQMMAEAFGELVMDEDDGRLFFHDYCAMTHCYLGATLAELNAIQVDGVKFEDAPIMGTTSTGQHFLWDARNRMNITKRAIATAKEWKKSLPDEETKAGLQMISTHRSLLATYANLRVAYVDKSISVCDSIIKYNQRRQEEAKKTGKEYFPISETEVYNFIYRLFLDLKQKVLMREKPEGYECYVTISDLWKYVHNSTKTPKEKEFREFINLLEYMDSSRFWINGLTTIKKGKGFRTEPSIAKAHLITIPTFDANPKRNEVIKLTFDKCILRGYTARNLHYLDEHHEEQKKMRAYDRMLLIPVNAVNDAQQRNPTIQRIFEATMKIATNLTEENLLERVFRFEERRQELLTDSDETIIQNSKKLIKKLKKDVPKDLTERQKLAEELREKQLANLRKDKSREKRNLKNRFQKAVEHGVIFNPKRMPTADGKTFKWKWDNREPKQVAVICD